MVVTIPGFIASRHSKISDMMHYRYSHKSYIDDFDEEHARRSSQNSRVERPLCMEHLMENPLHIHLTWKNITYTANRFDAKLVDGRDEDADSLLGVPDNKERQILKGVTGEACPGEMIAIMGGSGAGKTTLLNILAGRVASGKVEGSITVNGSKRPSNWLQMVGYVEQDDNMYAHLTVRETLTFAALLRLPKSIPVSERIARAEKIIKSLGLRPVADTFIGDPDVRGVSGGERKRVSIGIELLCDPQLIFLDEPTSGLDAATSYNVVKTIREIVDIDKRTVMMTIHQPRINILRLFSKVLLMSHGQLLFFGTIDAALEHFRQCGYVRNRLDSPADFFLDVISVDYRTEKTREEGLRRLDRLLDIWKFSSHQALRCGAKECSLARAKPKVAGAAAKMIDRPRPRQSVTVEIAQSNTSYEEFMILLRRNILIQMREKSELRGCIYEIIVLTVITCAIFFQMSSSGFAGVQDRLGMLYITIDNVLIMLGAPLAFLFCIDRGIIIRERYSRACRLWTFYLAQYAALVPMRLILTVIASTAIYYITGLRSDSFCHFLQFISIIVLCILNSIALGFLISSAGTTLHAAEVIDSTLATVLFLFGGGLSNSSSITWILRWFQYVTMHFYAYQALAQNELGSQQFGDVNGNVYLEQYALDLLPYAGCVGGLVLLLFGTLFLGYQFLKYHTRTRTILL